MTYGSGRVGVADEQVGCRHRQSPPGAVAGTVLSRPNSYSKDEYDVSVAVNLYHVLKFRVCYGSHRLRKFQCQAHTTLTQQREMVVFASQIEGMLDSSARYDDANT